jgi:hypothetical protein
MCESPVSSPCQGMYCGSLASTMQSGSADRTLFANSAAADVLGVSPELYCCKTPNKHELQLLCRCPTAAGCVLCCRCHDTREGPTTE